MARLFDNNISNRLERADVTSARFQQLSTWTVLAFFRIENTADDDRVIVAKWTATDNQKQFLVRTDLGAAPEPIEVFVNSNRQIAAIGSIELNTYYLVSVSNDGTGNASGLVGTVYEMDGTQNGTASGTHDGDRSDLTGNIEIGARDSDPMDGDIAYVAYFNTVLTATEERAYLRNPYQLAFSKGSSGCEFFVPCYGNVGPEPDLVHGRNFTVVGSLANGTNPPLGPFATSYLGFSAAAAAPAAARRIFVT